MAPATTVTADSFLESVRNSSLTGEENIRLAIANLPTDSVQEISNALVKNKILNPWQAKYLLAGHSGLRFGNYILINRTGQDSLGERFVATQESLGRTVDLQILPESVTAETVVLEKFLESASQLTHLDHPAILHLYDVAENQGRYFIVSESCQPLTSQAFRELPDSGLAHLRAARDLCGAISYLHEHDLAHGFLGADQSILLTDPGIVKIDQLAWSVLQRELVSRSVIDTFEKRRNADWVEAGKFLSKLLKAATSDQSLSDANRDSLAKAFSDLGKSGDPASRAMLVANKISDLVDRLEKRNSPVKRPLAEEASQATEAAGSIDRRTTNDDQTADKQSRSTRNSSKPGSASAYSKHRKSFPSRTVVISAVSLTLLAGLTAWFGWGKLFGGNAPKAQTSKVAKAETSQEKRSPAKRNTSAEKPKNESTETDEEKIASTAVEIRKDTTQTPGSIVEPDSLESNADINAINDQIPTTATAEPEIGKTGSVTEENTPAPETEKPELPKPITAPVKALEIPTDQEAGKKPGSATSDTGDLAESNPAITDPAPAVGIPRSFALVDGSNHESQKLGVLPEGTLRSDIRFTLAYDPETIGRGKNWFAIKPSGEFWNVQTSKRGEDQDLETVAALSVTDSNELLFKWAETVDEKHIANCLVNSILTVRAGGRIYNVTLRETVVFEGLALDAEKFSAEVQLEMPWLPKMDVLQIELGELRAPLGWTAEAMLVNEKFQNKQPARIVFRSLPEEQLMWLTIDGRIRSKVEFDYGVQTLHGGKLVALGPTDVEMIVAGFNSGLASVQAQIQQLNELLIDPPYGTKGKREDALKEAKKQAVAAAKNRDLAVAYQTWLKGLIDVPVPVRVMYPIGEQSIELARSSGWYTIEAVPEPVSEDTTSKK